MAKVRGEDRVQLVFVLIIASKNFEPLVSSRPVRNVLAIYIHLDQSFPNLNWRHRMIVVGVDVGGTFTDLILADLAKQKLTIHKTPSTPANPAIGVVTGLRAICDRQESRPRNRQPVHGTTVARMRCWNMMAPSPA